MSESPANRRVTHELDRTRAELAAKLNTLSTELTHALAGGARGQARQRAPHRERLDDHGLDRSVELGA